MERILRAKDRARVYQLQVSVSHVIVLGAIKLMPPSIFFNTNSLKITLWPCSVFSTNAIIDS